MERILIRRQVTGSPCVAVYGPKEEKDRMRQFLFFEEKSCLPWGGKWFSRSETYLTHRWCRRMNCQVMLEIMCRRRNSKPVVGHRQGTLSLRHHSAASGPKNLDQSRKYQVMRHPRETYLVNYHRWDWESNPQRDSPCWPRFASNWPEESIHPWLLIEGVSSEFQIRAPDIRGLRFCHNQSQHHRSIVNRSELTFSGIGRGWVSKRGRES